MEVVDDLEMVVAGKGNAFARYVKDNPLAMVATALVIGAVLARFAFLGKPGHKPYLPKRD